MCDVCGCESKNATAVDLQTGRPLPLGREAPREYVHVHADGTRHSHFHIGEHVHADGTRHTHDHAHPHSHGHSHPHAHSREHPHPHGEVVALETRILAKNDALAERNRAWLAARGVLAVNLMSAPGAGKTTLLERTIRDLHGKLPICVVEGDQATANDGERIRAAGAPVVQVNTGTGCHLDAEMVARGLEALAPAAGAVAVIENVGNLVCPALFDLGERRRVVVFSVTEGEDKPLKYPHMFRAADLVLLNKVDLLPHVDFNVERALDAVRAVNAAATVLRVSARTGAGLDAWYAWLGREVSDSAREQQAAERPTGAA